MSEQHYFNANTGRNAPCPCGSGKKFKRCCLNAAHPEIDRCADCGKEFENSKQIVVLDLADLESLSDSDFADLADHASTLKMFGTF